MHFNYEKGLIVDTILDKILLNQSITTMCLMAVKYNGFLGYIFLWNSIQWREKLKLV